MIQHVNEAIERTARITGVSPEEVVRKAIVRAEMPLYVSAGPSPVGVLAGGPPEARRDDRKGVLAPRGRSLG